MNLKEREAELEKLGAKIQVLRTARDEAQRALDAATTSWNLSIREYRRIKEKS